MEVRIDRVQNLLERTRNGDQSALAELLPLVYDELRGLARRVRARNGAAETVNTTALVHEAYERLASGSSQWNDRAHFFRVAATAMRHILVDYARRQKASKRGGEQEHVQLSNAIISDSQRPEEILALDEALKTLSSIDTRQGEIVELRYFVGLTIDETADALGLSPSTVKREWTVARAWLHREMNNS
ncbi:MAG: sigma-70 family RNA polymerase sigma factor [Bacteroidetes bacterium]|nr:sigma-70 family RNA polymerase sigma factor [Bacteroidota bacterium]